MDVSHIYKLSLASQASYADGLSPTFSQTDLADELFRVLSYTGITPEQANHLANEYEVLDQNINSDSGFSATLFQDRSSGEHVLALRGSDEIFPDFSQANIQNLLGGAARDQVVDMVNFYLRLTGEEGEPVPQYVRDVEIRGALFPSPGPEYRAIFSGAGITTYEGILPSGTAPGLGRIDATTQLSLTGHSLGGHLASAFALLLPSVTEQTATFNSAGFIGLFGEGFSSFASLMQRSILELPLNTSTHASVPVMDFASPQDPVSRIPGTSHLGDGLTSFSIEGSMAYLDSQPLYNHTIDPLVDALAVGDLLNSLAIGKSMLKFGCAAESNTDDLSQTSDSFGQFRLRVRNPSIEVR